MSERTLSLTDLAAAAKPDRNRAVDLYRAVAMAAVALGHWAAISISNGADGLEAGNALEQAPGMAWLTWLFQVMPLFFVVGGFSSALSLDSHNARNGRPQDWVIARLRRMMAPAITLAGTWLVILLGGSLLGVGGLVTAGAAGASIPLWFLANYTIDTALAPYVLPRFRKNPKAFTIGAIGVFTFFEALNLAGVPLLPQVNWILGWMCFQIAGFAWRDGLLPSGGRLLTWAAGFWGLAVAAVALGPWSVSMVHFHGVAHSPTHPPSTSLMLFGAAYSATALAAAPRISSWLARSPRAWAGVVAANSMALTVYLWHMTAAVGAIAIFYAIGDLPTAAVGTGAWWLAKLPIMVVSAIVLAGVVALVSGVERRALLAERAPWRGGQVSMLLTAGVVSVSVKLWADGDPIAIAASCGLLVTLWFTVLRAPKAVEAIEGTTKETIKV